MRRGRDSVVAALVDLAAEGDRSETPAPCCRLVVFCLDQALRCPLALESLILVAGLVDEFVHALLECEFEFLVHVSALGGTAEDRLDPTLEGGDDDRPLLIGEEATGAEPLDLRHDAGPELVPGQPFAGIRRVRSRVRASGGGRRVRRHRGIGLLGHDGDPVGASVADGRDLVDPDRGEGEGRDDENRLEQADHWRHHDLLVVGRLLDVMNLLGIHISCFSFSLLVVMLKSLSALTLARVGQSGST